MHRIGHIIITFLLVLILLPGCSQQATEPVVPVSEEAATSLVDKLTTAAQSQDPQVSITLTQEEVTSYLSLRVPNSPLQNPQVTFQPGQIIVTGQATAGVTNNLRVVAAPRVENGILQFDFREAKFGPIPLPAELLSTVNDQLRTVLTGNTIGQLNQVEVGAGTLTISGARLTPAPQ